MNTRQNILLTKLISSPRTHVNRMKLLFKHKNTIIVPQILQPVLCFIALNVHDCFVFLRQVLTVYPWLGWNSPCRLAWSWTHRDPTTSASQGLGLLVCSVTSGPGYFQTMATELLLLGLHKFTWSWLSCSPGKSPDLARACSWSLRDR